MSEELQVTLPKLGESIQSATIVQWFKKEGEEVQLDEPLLEVSTDKVNSEIPSPASGRLIKIEAQPDEELLVGAPLARIAVGKSGGSEQLRQTPSAAQPTAVPSGASSSEMKEFYSPALLAAAREKGVSIDELSKIPGTGAGGRLTRKDLEEYCAKGQTAPTCPGTSSSQDVDRVKMSGMRKAIAENMVRSFYEAPHASLVSEMDVTDLLQLIQRERDSFQQREGAKLTVTSFMVRAMTKALKEYPLLNSSLEGDTIVVKRYINVGIAVSVDQGLMVPVIKQCQDMSLSQIAQSVQDIALRARSRGLRPEEVKEGTVTLTNFGITQVSMGIPIIRHPEVAIIGMAAIQKKPAVVAGDRVEVRSLVNVSLTFDHRVIDGMYGCAFLTALKNYLETDLSL